jgi:hypothetical protein
LAILATESAISFKEIITGKMRLSLSLLQICDMAY